MLNFAYPRKAECDRLEAGMFLWLVWNWDSAWDVFKSVQASYLFTGDIKNLLNLAVSWPNVCLVQQTFVMCYTSLHIYLSFYLVFPKKMEEKQSIQLKSKMM